jgi:nucleoside-diphosphate-sugar epimerase
MTTEFPARDSRVAVFGATGGVGQLVTGCLAAQNYQVTVVSRSAESARTALATVPGQEQLRFSPCDLVTATVQQLREIVADCSCIVLCTGTTAFPSAK